MKCLKCEGRARRRLGVGEYRCGKCGHKWDPDEEYRKWLDSLPKPTPEDMANLEKLLADEYTEWLIRENKRLRCELAHITAQRNRFERLLTERKEKRKR